MIDPSHIIILNEKVSNPITIKGITDSATADTLAVTDIIRKPDEDNHIKCATGAGTTWIDKRAIDQIISINEIISTIDK